MIVKREKYYKKWVRKNDYDRFWEKKGRQYRKRTSFWLFGIIPIYISNEIISGDYQVQNGSFKGEINHDKRRDEKVSGINRTI